MLQRMQKIPLCKYQRKMKNQNTYSTYRRKNMKEKKKISSKENNPILHLQEKKMKEKKI